MCECLNGHPVTCVQAGNCESGVWEEVGQLEGTFTKALGCGNFKDGVAPPDWPWRHQ